jgi:beta-galactosidase
LGGYLGPLRDVAGVRVEEIHPLREGESVVLDNGGTADVWTEDVDLLAAETVAAFASGPVAGSPAITRNRYGAGFAWYIATNLDAATVTALLTGVLEHIGLIADEHPPEDVEIVRRRHEDTSFLFIINHSDSPVELSASGTDLLSGRTGPASVAPGGVAVLREEEK